MTTARLAACPSCARHVRVDEPRCPFCAAILPPSFSLSPSPRAPSVRLSRAALYAVGVGALSLSAAQGCGSADTPLYGAPPVDAGPRADTGSGVDASASDAGTDAPEDGASLEASSQDGAVDGAPEAASDAALDSGGVPIYGAPPPRGPGEP